MSTRTPLSYLQIKTNAVKITRRVRRYQREVIRIRISKKSRQHNGQKKEYKRTTNDLQNIHIKLKIE
jgi:16S rRNA U1498 N3-methylase RsmE